VVGFDDQREPVSRCELSARQSRRASPAR
jgi:hypothetical protein